MKKYYYITILAVIAILGLQTRYMIEAFNKFKLENIIQYEKALDLAMDEELHARRHLNRASKDRTVFIKALKDMTPQERDSLLKLTKKGDTLNVDNVRKQQKGITVEKISTQWYQDRCIAKNNLLNLNALDSIFNAVAPKSYKHRFLLYDKKKVATDSIGNLVSSPTYASSLYPIGTKGLMYLQFKMEIPLSDFLQHNAMEMILSCLLMIVVLFCVAFQLLVIRNKEQLLLLRENTINGTIHDLKSPLNGVVTLLSWLQGKQNDPAMCETLKRGTANVRQLVDDIESLLMTARIGRRKLVLRESPVDLLALYTRQKSELDILFHDKKHNIILHNHLPDDIVLYADDMYISNVLRNLIENALKYADEGVQIEVTFVCSGKMLSVEVKDNGWGIAPKYRKKIFHQFYQVPRDHEHYVRGYGIGLAQCKYIVEAHGGKIWLEKTKGQGCTFVFTLPLK